MKCRFKTNKTLTANKETKHTVTTSDGRTIHKKLASNHLKFRSSKKTEENIKPTKRYIRCSGISKDESAKPVGNNDRKQEEEESKETEKASSSKTFRRFRQEKQK